MYAVNSYAQLAKERNAPLEVPGEAGSVSLEDCQRLDCVKDITPARIFDTTLTYKSDTLSSTVQAVAAAYLHLSFTQGGIYPEQSNMPFLVLNEYAAEHFSQDGKEFTSLTVNTQLTMTIGEAHRKAILCGIFRDNLETPVIYISYSLAAKELPRAERTDLLVLLEQGSMAERARRELERLHVSVTYDENLLLRWKLQDQQAIQSLITALSLILCGAVLLRRENRGEQETASWERQALLLAGLTERHICQISRLRLLFFCCSGFLLAVIAAAAMGAFCPTSALAGIVVLIGFYLAVDTQAKVRLTEKG